MCIFEFVNRNVINYISIFSIGFGCIVGIITSKVLTKIFIMSSKNLCNFLIVTFIISGWDHISFFFFILWFFVVSHTTNGFSVFNLV
ncbi:hypothetical protein MrNuV_ORF013 [Macrobrachium rosenbergii nudivirus]|nr:hypothetical protein MrNuV_ORF013 [Macrobrachium rosenbergii nudivirus]